MSSPLKVVKTDRYIHKFTDIVSDTGIRASLLRKIAFVQLDKAIEQFLNSFNAWLHENDRDSDLFRAISDPDYREKLLEEYDTEHGTAVSVEE